MSRDTHHNKSPNHPDATNFLNELVLDLRKEKDGLPHGEITKERLEKAVKHIIELHRCFNAKG